MPDPHRAETDVDVGKPTEARLAQAHFCDFHSDSLRNQLVADRCSEMRSRVRPPGAGMRDIQRHSRQSAPR
jgi:hypothetical protein